MPKFHNNTDGYLWKKGVGPALAWFLVLLSGYFLFMILHGPVTGINNDYLTIAWAIATLWLLVYQMKRGDKLADSVHSYFIGYIGEWIIRKKLRKQLSDDYHLFYDCKIPEQKGNIDFVVVCRYGVFAVEVKSFMRKVWSIKYKRANDALHQSQNQAKSLRNYLKDSEIGIKIVQSVLVFAFQERYKPMHNDQTEVLGRDSVVWYFNDNLPKNKEVFNESQIDEIAKVLNKKNI